MRPASKWTAALSSILTPAVGYAQTTEQIDAIQQQVEAKLWHRRFFLWIEAVTGLPPAVALSAIIGLGLILVATICYWYARKKKSD